MRQSYVRVTKDFKKPYIYQFLKQQMPDMTSSSDRTNKSILAVGDESAIVDIIKQSLQRQEFKVCTFTDPFKALAHFNSDSKEDYHRIVLSDIRMPGMNGYEFVRIFHIAVCNYHLADALEQINESEHGAHHLIIYPNQRVLRELYTKYVKRQLEDENRR
jgi:CheY-like chemotaxis protein